MPSTLFSPFCLYKAPTASCLEIQSYLFIILILINSLINSLIKSPKHSHHHPTINIPYSFYQPDQPPPSNTMAIYTTFNAERPMLFGRSGYNAKPKTDDDDKKNHGRSGYNNKPKTDDDDDKKNHGRSGYNNKPTAGDDDDDKK